MMLKKLLELLKDSKVQIIFLVFIAAFVPRIYFLHKFPPAMIHDELNYVMNAKSLYMTGKNIPLTASALFSWGEEDYDVVISEIPSYIISLFVGPSKLNLFNSRIVYVLFGCASVVLLYLITLSLLGKEYAFWSALVFAFNPWSIHINRTALEVNFSVFFMLLGMYFLLKNNVKSHYLGLAAFILMFFTYLGAKLQLLPLISLLLLYKVSSVKKIAKRHLLTIFLVSISVFAIYTLTISKQPSGSRTDELLIFENKWAADIVNKERLEAIPNSLLYVFSNKATVIGRRIADVYIRGFSTNGLFSKGETVSVYSTWEYGQFHYVDFLLIVLGLIAVYVANRAVFWLLFSLVAISPWVSSIDLVEQTYAIRSYPMFPVLCIFAGAGLVFVRKNIVFGRYFFALILLLYGISVVYFMQIYTYRYPVYSAERWFLSERIIANYIKFLDGNDKVGKIYVSTVESPKIAFQNLIFYQGYYDKKEDVMAVNENLKKHDFSFKNFTVTQGCPKELGPNDVLISHYRFRCLEEQPGVRGVLDLKDAGTVYLIDKDFVCNDLELPRYYHPLSTKPFNIEIMDRETFCLNWIAKF